MKVRVSITLSEELLRAVDRRAGRLKETRSAFIETALGVFLKRQTGDDERNARDLEIINERAESLNREAADVLEYQNEGPATALGERMRRGKTCKLS